MFRRRHARRIRHKERVDDKGLISFTLKDTKVLVSRIITASCVRSGTLSNNTPPVRITLRHRRSTTVTDSEGGGEWGGCGGRGEAGDVPVMSLGVVVLDMWKKYRSWASL